jgi:hypothetical protein
VVEGRECRIIVTIWVKVVFRCTGGVCAGGGIGRVMECILRWLRARFRDREDRGGERAYGCY